MEGRIKKVIAAVLIGLMFMGTGSSFDVRAEKLDQDEILQADSYVIQSDDIQVETEAGETNTIEETEPETMTETQAESEWAGDAWDDPELAQIEEAYAREDGKSYKSSRSSSEFAEDRDIKAFGIDVYSGDGAIDWEKVKAEGVDFAIIRAGFRGYGSSGSLNKDSRVDENIQGALEAGIQVGIYFFSTAINSDEALEEAKFTVDIIKDYDITYPVAYDCEGYDNSEYRNYQVSKEIRTENAITFLDYVQSQGYQGMMYSSAGHLRDESAWGTGDLQKAYPMWVAQYYCDEEGNEYTSFDQISGRLTSYEGVYRIWQCSSQGEIDGIDHIVDLDIEYYDKEVQVGHTEMISAVATATSVGAQADITWKEADNAQWYRVYRRTDSTEEWECIAETEETSYSDSDIKADQIYYYTVEGANMTAGVTTYGTYDTEGLSCTYISNKVGATELVSAVASVVSDNVQADITWKEADNATWYKVYRRMNSEEKWQYIGKATNTSYTDKGIEPGKTYYYTVKGANTQDGETTYGSYDKNGLACAYKVGKTTLLSATASATSSEIRADITWEEADNAQWYRVYRRTSSEESWQYIGKATGTSYTDTDLELNQTYYYTVKGACKVAGTTIYGSYDKTGLSCSYVHKVGKTKMTSAKITWTSSGVKADITWEEADNAQWYRVYRRTSSEESWQYIGKATTTSYTDNTVKEDQTYYYTVKGGSKVVGVTVYGSYEKNGKAAALTLATPKLKADSAYSINAYNKIIWDDVYGAQGYYIYRKEPGGQWVNLGCEKRNAVNTSDYYIDNDIESGKTYVYTVKAYRRVNGKNVYSKYDTTGLYKIPEAEIQGVYSFSDGIEIDWAYIENVDGYRVYRKTDGGSWGRIADLPPFSDDEGTIETSYYIDTTAKQNTHYDYTVRAVCKAGKKDFLSPYDPDGISGICFDMNIDFSMELEEGGYADTCYLTVRNNGPEPIYFMDPILGDKSTREVCQMTFMDETKWENNQRVAVDTVKVNASDQRRMVLCVAEGEEAIQDTGLLSNLILDVLIEYNDRYYEFCYETYNEDSEWYIFDCPE
ncbi:MAG: GH25 family lysozyme [Coprococcus sp.]